MLISFTSFGGVDDTERDARLKVGMQHSDLPERRVTINQIAAWNMAYFRRAAELTQEELGERLGWSKAIVSAAERSWDGKRVRQFTADDLMGIAMALRVPLAALLLPPDDDRTAVRYVIDIPGGEVQGSDALLSNVLSSYGGDSPAMDAYRKRIIAAGVRTPADLAEILEEVRRRAGLRDVDAVTASLDMQREQLERRLNDLRAFERDYRARLHAYLVGQLRELWSEDMRPGVEELIEEASRKAAEGGGHATAVLLRHDGTYDFLQFDSASDQTEQDDRQ